MATPVELPDELMRELDARAEREGRTTSDLITELLRRGLDAGDGTPVHYVTFPLIAGTKPAAPGEELTPERIANLLIDQEAE